MVSIQTVTGNVDSSQLGYTLVHEHMRIRSESLFVQFPHLFDEAYELKRAIEQVNAAKERGVKTICDPTVMELGRDVRFLEKVSEATDVQIVAATGIYSYHYIVPHFQNRSIDYMADLFVRDIEVGIQNTSIKAGFLKCATDKQGITPDVEKVLRAVARAHLITGAPIMTHSYPQTGTGFEQLKIFKEEGVNPEHVLIGHYGDTDSIDTILRVLDEGAYIGMDRYGINQILSEERRNWTVVELIEKGYANRLFLSQDYCCTMDWYPEEVLRKINPKWSITYIMDEIIPLLLENGVQQEDIDVMMIDNPKRWLEGNSDIKQVTEHEEVHTKNV